MNGPHLHPHLGHPHLGWRGADRGLVTPVEMMFVLLFAIASVALLSYVGRLHAAGIEVTSVSQAAARAASQEGGRSSAEIAARDTVAASPLGERCDRPPRVELTWAASGRGTWQGGSVTVTVRCEIANASLLGTWSPGARTISMSDTQPIDRYQR